MLVGTSPNRLRHSTASLPFASELVLSSLVGFEASPIITASTLLLSLPDSSSSSFWRVRTASRSRGTLAVILLLPMGVSVLPLKPKNGS